MNLLRALICFVAAAAILTLCAVLTILSDGLYEIVFSNIALAGVLPLIALAWDEFAEEICKLVDITIPVQLQRARSSRRRWLRMLAGGSTALSFR